MQCLRNGLYFSVSDGSISSINPVPTEVCQTRNRSRRVALKLSLTCFFLDRKLLVIDLKLGVHTK